ncbi:hypothetical protein M434DRAFT_36568 [Hypoxylon sp. CO27-5]|nr:hypothetical protein M434DRAFT_36568 [Hypoxylon sp. CO27-5]
MHSVRSLLVFASSMSMFGSSVENESPVSKDETVSYTFQPGSGFSNNLTVQTNQALEYLKNEVVIDTDKVLHHPELFPASPSGNYTFPDDRAPPLGTLRIRTAHQSPPLLLPSPKRVACS